MNEPGVREKMNADQPDANPQVRAAEREAFEAGLIEDRFGTNAAALEEVQGMKEKGTLKQFVAAEPVLARALEREFARAADRAAQSPRRDVDDDLPQEYRDAREALEKVLGQGANVGADGKVSGTGNVLDKTTDKFTALDFVNNVTEHTSVHAEFKDMTVTPSGADKPGGVKLKDQHGNDITVTENKDGDLIATDSKGKLAKVGTVVTMMVDDGKGGKEPETYKVEETPGVLVPQTPAGQGPGPSRNKTTGIG